MNNNLFKFVNQDGKVLRDAKGKKPIQVKILQLEDIAWQTMLHYGPEDIRLISNGTLIGDETDTERYIYVTYDGTTDKQRFKDYLWYAWDKKVADVALPVEASKSLQAQIAKLWWTELGKLGLLFAATPAGVYILKLYNNNALKGTSRDLNRLMNAANKSITARQKVEARSSLWNS